MTTKGNKISASMEIIMTIRKQHFTIHGTNHDYKETQNVLPPRKKSQLKGEKLGPAERFTSTMGRKVLCAGNKS
jgi:hypothetical protein